MRRLRYVLVFSAILLGLVGAASATASTLDVLGPAAQIDAQPSSPSASTSASFAFSSTDPAATFVCSIDGAEPAPCTSPVSYDGPLGDGEHTFQVHATDVLGNVGAAAATSWTIDSVAPETTLEAAPEPTTEATEATFSFGSTESESKFECSLDDGPFTECTSSKRYGALPEGDHAFRVRAKDRAGNPDWTPASWKWTVSPAIVTATAPAPDASDVDPFTNVTVTFARPMSVSSFTTATFSLWRPNGTQVPAAPSYNATTRTATLTVIQPLAYATTYTVKLSTGIRTLEGLALARSITWAFTVTGTMVSRRINAGSAARYVGADGAVWEPDSWYRGGIAGSFTTRTISGTADEALFRDHRTASSSSAWWIYNIPIPNGTYRVRLSFAEVVKKAAGQRVFSVDVLDTPGTTPDVYNLDIHREVGANAALVRSVDVTITDGGVTLRSIARVGIPEIAAIEIVPIP